MNLCMLIGKIISEIEFKFMLGGNHISIAKFEMILSNNSLIKVNAYNEIADKCYKELIKNDIIVIQGELNSKMEIIINDFYV